MTQPSVKFEKRKNTKNEYWSVFDVAGGHVTLINNQAADALLEDEADDLVRMLSSQILRSRLTL